MRTRNAIGRAVRGGWKNWRCSRRRRRGKKASISGADEWLMRATRRVAGLRASNNSCRCLFSPCTLPRRSHRVPSMIPLLLAPPFFSSSLRVIRARAKRSRGIRRGPMRSNLMVPLPNPTISLTLLAATSLPLFLLAGFFIRVIPSHSLRCPRTLPLPLVSLVLGFANVSFGSFICIFLAFGRTAACIAALPLRPKSISVIDDASVEATLADLAKFVEGHLTEEEALLRGVTSSWSVVNRFAARHLFFI